MQMQVSTMQLQDSIMPIPGSITQTQDGIMQTHADANSPQLYAGCAAGGGKIAAFPSQ